MYAPQLPEFPTQHAAWEILGILGSLHISKLPGPKNTQVECLGGVPRDGRAQIRRKAYFPASTLQV